MRIYCAQQRFRKAIGLYHELCKNLSAEFGISPLKETTTLYYRIVDQWNASTYRLEEDSDTLLLGKAQAAGAGNLQGETAALCFTPG